MKIDKSNVFEVYEQAGKGRRLFTKNLTLGMKVYGEQLVSSGGVEYREWNPRRSKLGAMIAKGCRNIFIRDGSAVLYLGCASGTTVSHVSDIVGQEGFVFAVDSAPRVMRDMVWLSMKRPNIAPILADAQLPKKYVSRVSAVDVVFQDVAMRNQVDIFLNNCSLFLKDGGYGLLSVKARSIDVARKPKAIFNEARERLEREMVIVDYKTLEPYEADHAMFICKRKA